MARREEPGSGDVFATEIAPALETAHAEFVAEARRIARELGSDGREVTIDDVRAILPVPEGKEPRSLGVVFLEKIAGVRIWVQVGWRRSPRRMCHNRTNAVWRLASAI